jgi:hypothetical protein
VACPSPDIVAAGTHVADAIMGAVDDYSRLQGVLRPGEQLLWWGRPDPRLWFTGADLLLIPFSILWCGSAIAFDVGFSSGGRPVFAVFGVPLIAAGLYLVVGRFFYKHYRKKRTVYGITTQRALVAVGARSLVDAPWPPLVDPAWPGQPLRIRRSRDGTHASVILDHTGVTTLVLGPRGWERRSRVPGNTGLEYGTSRPQVAFYDVADAAAMLAALAQARGRNDPAS